MSYPKTLWKRLVFVTLCLSLACFLTSAGHTEEILYGVTFDEELITIDTTTGAGTLVGTLQTPMDAFGLGTRNDLLYTFDQQADRIKQLDPATAQTLATIDIGIGSVVGEGGITFRADGMGFLCVSSGNVGTLYSFDITVPSSTLIGTLNGLVPSMDGLDFNYAGVLYAISQDAVGANGNRLFTIDPATANTTLVGPTGLSGFTLAGLAFRSDGVLFAALGSNLYKLNTVTGAATLVGAIGFDSLSGLTFLGQACFEDETAWADGPRYTSRGNWATYTPYADVEKTVTLFAGQNIEAGTVHFSALSGGNVTITVTLNEGFRFNPDEEENLKVQGYNTAPSGNPKPGKFVNKKYCTTSPCSIVVPEANFYGVHVALQQVVECPEPELVSAVSFQGSGKAGRR